MLTIQERGVRMYLHLAQRELADAERVKRIYSRRKQGADTEALWSAWWELKRVGEEHLEKLRESGGLLHFGCVSVERTADGEYTMGGASV